MINGSGHRRARVLTTAVMCVLFISCGITLKQYEQAEKNLEDCVSGVRAPADEFCSKDSHVWTEAQEEMENYLKKLKRTNPKKYEKWSKEVSRVNVKWYDFLEEFDSK